MRSAPQPAADERTTLEQFLDFQRETLLEKCMDLSGEQLATRSVPPSDMSLLGLVRRAALGPVIAPHGGGCAGGSAGIDRGGGGEFGQVQHGRSSVDPVAAGRAIR